MFYYIYSVLACVFGFTSAVSILMGRLEGLVNIKNAAYSISREAETMAQVGAVEYVSR